MASLQRAPAVFQDLPLPPDTRLVGLSALAFTWGILAPVRRPACVSTHHVRGSSREQGGWRIFDKRYEPGETLGDHLTFALRQEDLDLAVLKRIFEAAPEDDIAAYVRSAPTGITHRQAWYLFEFLTGRLLDVPDAPTVKAVDILDPKRYFTLPGTISKRHKVKDNLLGTPEFCPVIRRTPLTERFVTEDMSHRVEALIGRVSARLVARAASFMLLADSRASFEIEGERPPRSRIERWGRAVMEAGKRPLSLAEIERLHAILLADSRFVKVGLRDDGVFLGERGWNGEPLPEFIGARPDDLPSLMKGLIECNAKMGEGRLAPVLQAAAIAFGFVYIHPLQDGNGRLHRCLIHHVLADRRFSRTGLVFPVSSVMLERIEEYRATLQAHSGPLMPYIEWRPTSKLNVDVLNDTADLYRYFDCTAEAEFLYACVQRTVERDLPRELDYLRRHDEALRGLMETVEMPDRLAEDFLMFVRQYQGTLSKRRREGPFAQLTDQEVTALESVVNEAFDGFDEQWMTPP